LETSKREAMKHLVANEFKFAMAGALQAQRHSIELFGADRTELVPSYLLLAEASMGFLYLFHLSDKVLVSHFWTLQVSDRTIKRSHILQRLVIMF
jgi:hypothetical protein